MTIEEFEATPLGREVVAQMGTAAEDTGNDGKMRGCWLDRWPSEEDIAEIEAYLRARFGHY